MFATQLVKSALLDVSDYMMMVRIVDASLDDQNSKLKCVLFARSLNRLPRDAKTGDILRVHRLKVSHPAHTLYCERIL